MFVSEGFPVLRVHTSTDGVLQDERFPPPTPAAHIRANERPLEHVLHQSSFSEAAVTLIGSNVQLPSQLLMKVLVHFLGHI